MRRDETLAIHVEYAETSFGTVQDRRHCVAALRGLPRGVGCLRGYPYRRVWLLQGSGPDVHLTLLEELAFPGERTVVGGPRFDDEIDRLPHPFFHENRIRVRRRDLLRDPAHEADLGSAARDDVDHRHLFGDTHRIAPIGDRVAQRQDASILRRAGEDAHRERHRRLDTCRGRVVLVEHDVEAVAVGALVEVEVTLVQLVAHLRVVHLVGQRHSDRFVRVLIDERIRHLGEHEGTHGCSYRTSRRNSSTDRASAVGCSSSTRWPAPSIVITLCGSAEEGGQPAVVVEARHEGVVGPVEDRGGARHPVQAVAQQRVVQIGLPPEAGERLLRDSETQDLMIVVQRQTTKCALGIRVEGETREPRCHGRRDR